MAKTSKTMLNESGESRQPCLAPDLRGNAFSLSPLSMRLAMGLSYIGVYYIEVCFLYTHFVGSLYDK